MNIIRQKQPGIESKPILLLHLWSRRENINIYPNSYICTYRLKQKHSKISFEVSRLSILQLMTDTIRKPTEHEINPKPAKYIDVC